MFYTFDNFFFSTIYVYIVKELGVFGCCGSTARDFRGEVLFNAAEEHCNATSSLQTKILAILKGLCLAKDFDLHCICLESDCLLAMAEIGKRDSSFS